MALDLTIDAAWAVGLLLAMTRVAAFVIASPILGKAIPATGRLAFTLVVAVFVAEPVAGLASTPALLSRGLVNAAVGAALGLLTGLVFHLFAFAGGMVDTSSMLSASQTFDPTQGQQAAIVGRIFATTATALVAVSGGFALLAGLLALSVEALPLGGAVAMPQGLAGMAVDALGDIFVVGLEVAMPALAVLFVTEIVLGVAARFAPQANIFLVGMPAKLLVAMLTTGGCLVLFPEAVEGVLDAARDTAVEVLRAFGGQDAAPGG